MCYTNKSDPWRATTLDNVHKGSAAGANYHDTPSDVESMAELVRSVLVAQGGPTLWLIGVPQ